MSCHIPRMGTLHRGTLRAPLSSLVPVWTGCTYSLLRLSFLACLVTFLAWALCMGALFVLLYPHLYQYGQLCQVVLTRFFDFLFPRVLSHSWHGHSAWGHSSCSFILTCTSMDSCVRLYLLASSTFFSHVSCHISGMGTLHGGTLRAPLSSLVPVWTAVSGCTYSLLRLSFPTCLVTFLAWA